MFLRNPGEVGDQSGSQAVPGQDVPAPSLDQCGGGGQVVQHPLQLKLDLLHPAALGSSRGLAGQLEQVGPLIVIQVQDPGEGVQHGSGRLHATLLQAGVVIGTDRGQLGDLLAPQPGDPA